MGTSNLALQFDALHTRIANAASLTERALAAVDREYVEKTLWGSPAGKKRIANRLAAMLPPHRVYVEPFAGSGAVLFAKEPSPVEVINDANPEIADAFKLIKGLTPEKLQRLAKMPWVGDEARFRKLYDAKPTDEVARLHRFLYVTHFSYGKMRGKSFSPSSAGVEAKTITRLGQHAPRLRKVKVYSGDYEPVLRKYDGKDTVFFLDPPYAGYDAAVGEKKFDEHRFVQRLKALKGKWLMTYGIRGELPKLVKAAGFHIKRIRTPRTIRSMRGVGGSSVLTQLLVSNYELTKKSVTRFDDGAVIDDWTGEVEREFSIRAPIIFKSEGGPAERFVLGVVLEPEVVDAQDDIYSEAEVRKAAHLFMEEYGGLGLQHEVRVNGKVKILESYLTPTNCQIGDVAIKKGTWVLAVRVLDDELWKLVKSGALSGFSIGGTARRVDDGSAAEA